MKSHSKALTAALLTTALWAGGAGAQGSSVGAVADTPSTPAQATGEPVTVAGGWGRDLSLSRIPEQAGEATTMVDGQPNIDPNDPRYAMRSGQQTELDRLQARAAREAAVMGQRGSRYNPSPGTPANAPWGALSVQEGGTPD